MTFRLYTGESRLMEFVISDSRHESFSISQAYYQVYLGDDLVDSGVMDIDSDTSTISFRFSPENTGIYRATIQYIIGQDTMKERYDIEVVDVNL